MKNTKKIIGAITLFSGIVVTVYSVTSNSTTVAFVGLTLILWAFLFLLQLPGKYVSIDMMNAFFSSTFSALNQVLQIYELKGKATYIAVPPDMYLPYEIGVKDEFIFIPKFDLTDEQILAHAFDKKIEGLRVTPPGLGLLNLIEKKDKLRFHEIDIDDVIEILPSIIVNNLDMSNKVEITYNKLNFERTDVDENHHDEVIIKISRPEGEYLCNRVTKDQLDYPGIGYPLISLIACILTRSLKKSLQISECLYRNDVIEIRYQILRWVNS